MSTRIRTGGTSGVPLSVGAQIMSKGTTTEPRIRKRIPSLPGPSSRSAGPLRARPGPSPKATSGRAHSSTQDRTKGGSSATKHKRAAKINGFVDDFDDHCNDDCDLEQDVRFINVPSKREEASLDSALYVKRTDSVTSSHKLPRDVKQINPKEVLAQCQETEWDRVYEIGLHASHIGAIHNLEKFTKLRVLDLSCNYIERIDNLQYTPDLRELKLYDNQISEITNLDRVKELCHLQLQHNKISAIGKGLGACRKLKVLRLDSNYLNRLEVRELCGCAALTTLDLSNNRLDTLTAISCLPNLEELHAMNNRLRSVGDLSRCKKLQEVDVSHNRLTDVSGLKGLPNLIILHASHNCLSSVRSLGKLKCLQELNISNNRLTELSSLAQFYPALQILDASDNNVELWTEVCSLQSLGELVELYVSGNPFSMEHGDKPHYFQDAQHILPNLDILDGAHVRRASSRGGTPLMRPMSASTAISSRQVETQLNALQTDLASFEANFESRMESIRDSLGSLPVSSPSPRPLSQAGSSGTGSRAGSARPVSRSGKRSRIQQAKSFAEQNFGDTV